MTPPRRSLTLVLLAGLAIPSGQPSRPARGDEPGPLKVRIETGRGPHFVGQGIELGLAVLAGDRRPDLELPRLAAAELWVEDTSFDPVSATGIGNVVTGANRFQTHLRLVPRRAGPLEIPPITARLDGRSGRSPALRLTVEPVPLEGRPADFLGGVGDFAIRALATPATVAVGQEFLYRIEVTGPGAWGMTARPELDRVARLAIAPGVEPLAVEESRDPPSRTFLWRIRPTRPGRATLPPITVSAFDPRSRRFLTRAGQGTTVEAVAIPVLDPRSIADPAEQRPRPWGGPWLWTVVSVAGLGGGIGLALLRRRGGRAARSGPAAARSFARRAAQADGQHTRDPEAGTEGERARRILADLAEYARLGLGRPPGALTPREAAEVVRRLTGSGPLAEQAAALCEECDRVLFSERIGTRCDVLGGRSHELFTALGRAEPAPEERAVSARTSRTSD
jgi:hypothetical protein